MNLIVPGHRIIKLIGTGSMGMVYLAEQPTLHRQVALKVLYPHHAKSRIRRERFFNEARVMANMIHPNIVQLFNLQEADGNIIIVMEFVDGRNMDEMIGLEYGPITYEKALPLITDMLKGLGYAHSMDIVHRDIKPGNVMVTHDHVAKIMDFGVAKLLGQKGLTKAGAQVGTLAYMSPEQVLGKDVDQRSDIYSLGMTLYEMLAGRLPSDGHDISDHVFMNMILKEKLPDPRDFYPHIPEWLVALVYKAIEKKPENRFFSCEEFLSELERGLATGSVSVSLKRSFFSRFSSAIRNIVSPQRMPAPTYFTEGSSGGSRDETSSSSSGHEGESLERREERKRRQLQVLLGKHSGEETIHDRYESSVEDDSKNEILAASEIAEEMDREFEETYPEHNSVIVHGPDDLMNSVVRESESDSKVAGDPIDTDNEPSIISVFFGKTRNKVAGIAVLIASIASIFMFTGSGSGDDLPDIDPIIESFEPHLRIIEEINTTGIDTSFVKDVAISREGDIAVLSSYLLSVYNTNTAIWNSVELTTQSYDVAFLFDSGISCSQDSSKLILFSPDLDEYSSLDYQLEAPSKISWISDSLFCGLAPLYRPGDAAGHGVYLYDSSGSELVMYTEYSFDISQFSRPSFIPPDLRYSIYYDKPPVAFIVNGSVYTSSSSGTEYLVNHFSSFTDSSGTLVSTLDGTITHDFNIVAKSAEQLEADISLFIERKGVYPPEGWTPDPYLSVIKWLGVDGDSRLWVLRGNTEEILFDLFSTEGEYIRSVIADLPDGKDWQFRFAGDNILAYATDYGGVTVYRMEYVDPPDNSTAASNSHEDD